MDSFGGNISEISMNQQLRRTLITGSAAFGVWDSQHFSAVHDYETWEAELLEEEDIERHIAAGHFVPITIYSDGAFEFEVRVGVGEARSSLNSRERQHLIASSEPYLFRSAGELNISGIEFVEATPEEQVGQLQIIAGEYDIIVHHNAWENEPGAKDAQGQPSPEALADFVVLVNKSDGTVQNYQTEFNTFESAT